MLAAVPTGFVAEGEAHGSRFVGLFPKVVQFAAAELQGGQEPLTLLGGQFGIWLDGRRHQIEMQPDGIVWILKSQVRGDNAPEVAALNAIAAVSQDFGHQLVPQPCGRDRADGFRFRLRGESESR
jgi:hypothetical protein